MPTRNKTICVLLLILAAGLSAAGQGQASKSVEIPVIEANPDDVGSVDGIVKAFYEVVSGGVGQPRQWSRDRTLYIPDIRFVQVNERNGKTSAEVMTHQQYVDGGNDFLVKEGFTEQEIHRVTRKFGNLIQMFSTYEFKTTGQRKVTGRGINTIDMFFDGKRWWVSAVAWQEESSNNPIPKEFLP